MRFNLWVLFALTALAAVWTRLLIHFFPVMIWVTAYGASFFFGVAISVYYELRESRPTSARSVILNRRTPGLSIPPAAQLPRDEVH
jgi:hypothetical protein